MSGLQSKLGISINSAIGSSTILAMPHIVVVRCHTLRHRMFLKNINMDKAMIGSDMNHRIANAMIMKGSIIIFISIAVTIKKGSSFNMFRLLFMVVFLICCYMLRSRNCLDVWFVSV